MWVDYNTGDAVCDREGNPMDEEALALALTQGYQGEAVEAMEEGAEGAKEGGSGGGGGTAAEATEVTKSTVGANVMTKDTSGMKFTAKGKAKSQQVKKEASITPRMADVHSASQRLLTC